MDFSIALQLTPAMKTAKKSLCSQMKPKRRAPKREQKFSTSILKKKILQAFVEEVEAKNPQVFIGWNVLNFDFRYLIDKAASFDVPFHLRSRCWQNGYRTFFW